MKPRCLALTGRSAAIRRARQAVAAAARADVNVLIVREAGCCGAEAAAAIHEQSARRARPFSAIDCTPTGVARLREQFFAPTRGPGGPSGRTSGGTLFIDEVERLTLDVQQELASWLRSKDGTSDMAPARREPDVRLIAGCRADIRKRVAGHRFRPDLYYCLSVLVVELPPLRDRIGDIPDIVDFLRRDLPTSTGQRIPELSQRVLTLFRRYHWPGNLRDLARTVARLVALRPGAAVRVRDLPEAIRDPRPAPVARFELPAAGVNLDALERDLIRQALERHDGNQTHAARALGLTRQTLRYRMEKYGVR